MKILRAVCISVLLLSGVVISPVHAQFTQQGSKLVGADPAASGPPREAVAVAISADGNTAISGAYGDSSFTGAAFVFTRSTGVWAQQGDKLVGSDASGNGDQGNAVAISGDGNTVIVGGDVDNSDVGAAWIFTRSGGAWTQQGSKLVGTGTVGNAFQGRSVALSYDGNTALVGGYTDDGSIGAAWVFTRSGGVWTQQGGKLVGTGAVGNAYQGSAVALSGDGNTALIGGPRNNSFAGAGWIFTRSGGVWTQESELTGTGGEGAYVLMGTSVALSLDGNTAIFGGNYDSSNFGAAWIFTQSGGVWTQQGSKLVGTGNVGSSPNQGMSVGISGTGDTVIIGGPQDNSGAGAAWIFTRSSGVWSQDSTKLYGTGSVGNAQEGYAVAMSGDANTVMLGGYYDNASTGAAWIFTNTLNWGGGGTTSGGYYYANSEPGGAGAPSQPVFAWAPDTSSQLDVANPTSGNSDDGYWGPIAMPFSFTYFGNTYSSIYIGTNGILSFGGGTTEHNNYPIPSASGPHNFIALAWGNMVAIPGTTHIYYGGDASQFAITYSDLTPIDSSSQMLTMQLILYPSGGIKMQYDDSLSTADRLGYINSNTIGLENSDGTLGVQYRYNGAGGKMFGSSVAVQYGSVDSVLAIQLGAFKAIASTGSAIHIEWQTISETNNYGFYVERKDAAHPNYTTVSNLIPGAGTSLQEHTYTWDDSGLTPGVYNYRLRQQDLNGTVNYSSAIRVTAGVLGVKGGKTTPREFKLYNNYPNPFNPTTNIKYDLASAGHVVMTVFNTLGQQVAQLVDRDMQAGSFSQTWNANSVSSGEYFVRIAVADHAGKALFSDVKRLMLVK